MLLRWSGRTHRPHGLRSLSSSLQASILLSLTGCAGSHTPAAGPPPISGGGLGTRVKVRQLVDLIGGVAEAAYTEGATEETETNNHIATIHDTSPLKVGQRLQ